MSSGDLQLYGTHSQMAGTLKSDYSGSAFVAWLTHRWMLLIPDLTVGEKPSATVRPSGSGKEAIPIDSTHGTQNVSRRL